MRADRVRARRSSPLQELARGYGIQTAYVDAMDQPRAASDADLRATLEIMGIDIKSDSDVRDALADRKRSPSPLPPISVAWHGEATELELVLPEDAQPRVILKLESEESLQCNILKTRRRTSGGRTFAVHRLSISPDLPAGYHTIVVEHGADHRFETGLFAAPERCYAPDGLRMWGVFAPAYAIHAERSWGAGDLTDLAAVYERTRQLGGDFIGILPILATFLDQPFDSSPYNPMSRLHWNELFLDVTRVPGFSDSSYAKDLVGSAAFQRDLSRLQKSELVDYRGAMKLKRSVLEAASRCFFELGERSRYEAFLEANPDVERYASFRAAGEMRGEVWRRWPDVMKNGSIDPTDYREADRLYHLFVQWAMHEQLESFAAASGPGLYLDYPLGVHPDGYDTWRDPALFAERASVGSPPDAFFTKGQNWGFAPMRPDVMVERKLDYFIAAIRNQLKFAGMLRIDHVMALNRLFWIPSGAEPSNGVYVQYPAEAMYAVLAIESHRFRSVIIGEDLGTVPEEVRSMMEKRGVRRMYVLQYEMSPSMDEPATPKKAMVASINTHDMPTFTSYWNGMDIDDRQQMSLLDDAGSREEHVNRETIRTKLATSLKEHEYLKLAASDIDDRTALIGALDFLSSSDAEMVLVNLEDLWGETSPQNVPGTSSDERPNWQRKLPRDIASIFDSPEVVKSLRMIDDRRKNRPEASVN